MKDVSQFTFAWHLNLSVFAKSVWFLAFELKSGFTCVLHAKV